MMVDREIYLFAYFRDRLRSTAVHVKSFDHEISSCVLGGGWRPGWRPGSVVRRLPNLKEVGTSKVGGENSK